MSADMLSWSSTWSFVEDLVNGGRLRAILSAAPNGILYGLRLWASVSLALFVAYYLELDNAYWAAATAAVVCQPSLGASLRKGRFRSIGTIVGAIFIVALTAALPQSRASFLAGIAIWCTVCAFLASVLRNFASYAAALAGFTAVIIFAGAVDNPGDTFHVAVTRSTEISIGILSAGLVLTVSDLGSARQRLVQSLAAIAHQTCIGLAKTFGEGPGTSTTSRERHELTMRIGALDGVIDEAIGEASDLRSRANGLEAAIEGLLGVISAWRGIDNHLNRLAGGRRGAATNRFRSIIAQVARIDWQSDPTATREFFHAQERQVLTMPASNVSSRILVDSVAAALRGLARTANVLVLVTSPGREWADRAGHWIDVPDMLPPVINAFRALATLTLTEIVWIETGWSGGQSMIIFAAIGILRFSPRADEAYPTAVRFAVGVVLSAVLAAIVNFAVLPATQNFVELVLVLAVLLVPFGALSAASWQTIIFVAVVATFMPLLAPLNPPTYNPETFFNSALAIVSGTIAAMLFLRLVPPMEPAWRTRRLLDISLRDLRRLAIRRTISGSSAWIGLLSRRLEAMPRQATLEEIARLVAVLSIGEAVINLRQSRVCIPGKGELDRALSCLAAGNLSETRRELTRFIKEQREGSAREALAGMRARAAAKIIIGALAQRGQFFGSTIPFLGSSTLRLEGKVL
jgi:uncharacterized membrane protein YccC